MKKGSGCGIYGGDMTRDASKLEKIWDEVQALNRAVGPWGIFGKRKEMV